MAIFLPETMDREAYSLTSCVGYETERFQIRVRASSHLIKELKKTQVILQYRDIATKERFKRIAAQLDVLQPELLVPLLGKDSFTGFLIFGKKLSGRDFTNSELGFISSIAEAAAIALDRAYLYQMATLDRMSGLYVNHYFKNRLLTEMLRAKRYKQHISLIMMDIDHFKQVNDTWGHQQGDIIIKQIAELILAGIREIDIAARYGGEEFAVILPETDLGSATTVAERLRLSIQNFPFKTRKGLIPVTASFGVANLIATDASPAQLIERADELLYESKEAGRNKVTCQR